MRKGGRCLAGGHRRRFWRAWNLKNLVGQDDIPRVACRAGGEWQLERGLLGDDRIP